MHRVLAAAVAGDSKSPVGVGSMSNIADRCNQRKMNADKAQDQCDVLFLNLLARYILAGCFCSIVV